MAKVKKTKIELTAEQIETVAVVLHINGKTDASEKLAERFAGYLKIVAPTAYAEQLARGAVYPVNFA